ncbi:MAG: phosphonopyruvate decarboxylase [Lachnospiraceae bacterium]|nr:phosphonopyruvate decarboxylase [Lachnospiraceae bacterium]
MYNIFVDELRKNGIDFFTGVPDSYLNGFCRYLSQNCTNENNVITANEGNAIALAAGYYIATGKIPVVYMQNSGLGNAVNPLVSLTDKNVYSIPMILVIGYRGEPETNDWAQHSRQGQITVDLLKLMNIKSTIIDRDSNIEEEIKACIDTIEKEKSSYAFVIKKGVFTEKKSDITDINYSMGRMEAIEAVLDYYGDNAIFIATTGRATRELYHLREERGEAHNNDFLNVGAMGHTSSIAMGIALKNKAKKVVCLDGDGALVMHLGAMTTAKRLGLTNFIHIVLNNGVHESVGGEPTAGYMVDFTTIARGCGYATMDREISDKAELLLALNNLSEADKPIFLDVRVHQGLGKGVRPLNINHKDLLEQMVEELNIIEE